ncbi:MFS transporter small subunit [Kineococcus sp. SYSU DK004]|uniref:MFS transporter small subunit n=1 Tax=Kineococcus sp. SYSU DK004 TaxID=3383125 RepID=UPI003D7CE4AF
MSTANSSAGGSAGGGGGAVTDRSTGRVVLGWALVGIPLAYGLVETLVRASRLFTG